MDKNKPEEIVTETYMEAEENLVTLFVRILKKIWNIRVRLCKIACLGALLGLVIALSTPKEYSVSVTLAPEAVERSGGGLAGMAASLLGGGNAHSNAGALNALLTPEVLNSTPFLLEILDIPVVNEQNGVNTTLSAYIQDEAKPWWTMLVKLPGLAINGIKSLFREEKVTDQPAQNDGVIKLTYKQTAILNQLRTKLMAIIDKKTSIITLDVTLQDPVVTAVVADSVVSKLQKYLIKYKISKAQENYNYWDRLFQDSKKEYFEAQENYAQFVDRNNNVIYQSVIAERERLQNEVNMAYQMYTHVAQELQMAKAKVQESKTVFFMLEPAVVPLYPSNAGKVKMMVIFAFLFLIGSIGWEICLKGLLHEFKNKLK